MNSALKWKLVVGFLLAFLAGGAVGAFLTASQARHFRADFPRAHHRLVERMRNRMKVELDLTPEQITRTAPIFDRAASELEKVRAETGARVRQIVADANRELAPELTDAQRARLEAWKKEPRAGRKSRNLPPHRGAEPPE